MSKRQVGGTATTVAGSGTETVQPTLASFSAAKDASCGAPSRRAERRQSSRMASRRGTPGPAWSRPLATVPPASVPISAAAWSQISAAPAGSTPRAQRWPPSVEMPRRYMVRRTPAGGKWADSISTRRVDGRTSVVSPPMIPAIASGSAPAVIRVSPESITRSRPSRVRSRSPSAARRTTIRRPGTRSRSKACSGWPWSSSR